MEIIRAHIKDGVVVNLSVGDTEKPWTAPQGITVIELPEGANAGIGHTYDGKAFAAPVEPAPVEKTLTVEDKLTDLQKRMEALEKAARG